MNASVRIAGIGWPSSALGAIVVLADQRQNHQNEADRQRHQRRRGDLGFARRLCRAAARRAEIAGAAERARRDLSNSRIIVAPSPHRVADRPDDHRQRQAADHRRLA